MTGQPCAARFGTHSVSQKSIARALVFLGRRGSNRRFSSMTTQNQIREPPTRVALLFGAGDRTRTGTLSPAVDFESTTSTNSITPAGVSLAFINNRRWRLCPLRLPVAVPKISCSLFAHEILTAATRSPPLTPPLAAVGSLPNFITPAGVVFLVLWYYTPSISK